MKKPSRELLAKPKSTPPKYDQTSQEVILGKGGPSAEGWHKIVDAYHCMKEYQLNHVRGVRLPLRQVPDALAVGIYFHAMRARWFSRGFDTSEKTWQSLRSALFEEQGRLELPTSHEAVSDAQRYMQEYVLHWSKRPKPKVIGAEYLVGPAPVLEGFPEATRTARLDDFSIYQDAGNVLCLGEAKTSSDINNTIKEYTLHGQPALQLLLFKMSPQGEAKFGRAHGVMLDILQKGYGGKPSKFARQFVEYPDRVLQWHAKNMVQYLKAASMIDWNTDTPRNITSCTRMIGKMRVECPYLDLCRFGKSAAGKYVDKKGNSLVTWKPTKEQKIGPWD